MKRKILLCVVIIGSLLMCGCGKKDEQDVIKDLTKKVEETKGYHLTGNLEIVNNEDTYTYDVKVYYQKDNNYIIITGVFLTEEEAKNMGNDISANGITCVIKQEKFTSDFKEKIEQQDYEAIIKELGS